MHVQDGRPVLSGRALWLFDVALGIAAMSTILGCAIGFVQFARSFLGTP